MEVKSIIISCVLTKRYHSIWGPVSIVLQRIPTYVKAEAMPGNLLATKKFPCHSLAVESNISSCSCNGKAGREAARSPPCMPALGEIGKCDIFSGGPRPMSHLVTFLFHSMRERLACA